MENERFAFLSGQADEGFLPLSPSFLYSVLLSPSTPSFPHSTTLSVSPIYHPFSFSFSTPSKKMMKITDPRMRSFSPAPFFAGTVRIFSPLGDGSTRSTSQGQTQPKIRLARGTRLVTASVSPT